MFITEMLFVSYVTVKWYSVEENHVNSGCRSRPALNKCAEVVNGLERASSGLLLESTKKMILFQKYLISS